MKIKQPFIVLLAGAGAFLNACVVQAQTNEQVIRTVESTTDAAVLVAEELDCQARGTCGDEGTKTSGTTITEALEGYVGGYARKVIYYNTVSNGVSRDRAIVFTDLNGIRSDTQLGVCAQQSGASAPSEVIKASSLAQ
jgi:hypothetical protein